MSGPSGSSRSGSGSSVSGRSGNWPWPTDDGGGVGSATWDDADDRGAAVVWVLVAVLLIGFLATAAILAAGIASLRWRAATAADLAALAAAHRAAAGAESGSSCDAAERVARENRAEVVSCAVDPSGVVDVTVKAVGGGLLARIGPARAVARAGPGDG